MDDLDIEVRQSVLPVSVIVPVYNAQSTLERCVTSINAGQMPQEIIIIDDASADESVLVAKKLAESNRNITVISRPINGGAAAARRDGFYAAQCDHVAFVDADDYMEDGALEEAFNGLVDTKSDLCILQLWRSEGDRTFESIDLSKVPFPITGRDAAELTLGSWSIHPLGVARKDIYLKAYAGFTLLSTNADELITRLAFINAGKVVSCQKKYYYIVNRQSTSNVIHPRLLTVLDSDIWLLKFCNRHGFDKFGALLRCSMTDLWRLFRQRRMIGVPETREKLRRFTHDVCFVDGFFSGILRERKALVKFLLVGIYCRLPLYAS
jgi:glycosyltransferase involved in cell wall biosynthesis